MLSIEEVISLLRTGADIRKPPEPELDEEGNPVESEDSVQTELDSDFLYLSDDELLVYLKLGASRGFPEYTLEELPEGAEYGVYLLAKVELYTALAVKRSDTVDMGVDNNTYLKGSQKFDHFMKMAEDAKQQYDDWLKNEGAEILGLNVVNTYDTMIDNTRYDARNRPIQPTPKIRLRIDYLGIDKVEFSWKPSNVFDFSMYKVYISREPIVDMYADGNLYSDKVNKDAQCVMTTHDIRNCAHRVGGLEPDTDYYVAVFVVELTRVFGFTQIHFVTPEEQEEEPDFSEDEIQPPEEGDSENELPEEETDSEEDNKEDGSEKEEESGSD